MLSAINMWVHCLISILIGNVDVVIRLALLRSPECCSYSRMYLVSCTISTQIPEGSGTAKCHWSTAVPRSDHQHVVCALPSTDEDVRTGRPGRSCWRAERRHHPDWRQADGRQCVCITSGCRAPRLRCPDHLHRCDTADQREPSARHVFSAPRQGPGLLHQSRLQQAQLPPPWQHQIRLSQNDDDNDDNDDNDDDDDDDSEDDDGTGSWPEYVIISSCVHCSHRSRQFWIVTSVSCCFQAGWAIQCYRYDWTAIC